MLLGMKPKRGSPVSAGDVDVSSLLVYRALLYERADGEGATQMRSGSFVFSERTASDISAPLFQHFYAEQRICVSRATEEAARRLKGKFLFLSLGQACLAVNAALLKRFTLWFAFALLQNLKAVGERLCLATSH